MLVSKRNEKMQQHKIMHDKLVNLAAQMSLEQKQVERFELERTDKTNKIIIAFGDRTGAGTSTFCNRVVGDKSEFGNNGPFKTSSGSETCTQEFCKFVAEIDNKNITIVDSPGIDGSDGCYRKHGNDLCKYLKRCGGINTFVLVMSSINVRLGMLQSMLEQYSNIFGDEFFKRLIIVVTRVDSDVSHRQFVESKLVETLRKDVCTKFNLNIDIPVIPIGANNYEDSIATLIEKIPSDKFTCNHIQSPIHELKMQHANIVIQYDDLQVQLNSIQNQLNFVNDSINALEKVIKSPTNKLIELIKNQTKKHAHGCAGTGSSNTQSNQQNQNKISLKDVQEEEIKYFMHSKNMKNICDNYKGSNKLSKHLAQLQTKTMMQALPELKEKINKKYDELREKMNSYPEIMETTHQCQSRISIMISKTFSQLNRIKDGNIIDIDESQPMLSSILLGFYEDFAKEIRLLYPRNTFLQESFLDDIKKKTGSCRGFIGLPNEIHPLIAVKVIRCMVQKLETPSMELVGKIFDETAKQIKIVAEDVFKDYNIVQKEIIYSFNIIMQKQKAKAIEYVNDIIKAEKRKPFTLNHYYMTTVHKMEVSLKEMTDQNNQKGVQEESKSDKLIVIRISGRKGSNSKSINGDYIQQNEQYNDMAYFKKINSNERLYWSEISKTWYLGNDFEHYKMSGEKLESVKKTENAQENASFSWGDSAKNNKYNPEDVTEWKVYEGDEKADVTDKNIKVEKLFISKSLYENTECVLTGKDILKKSNEDILIIKQAIKISAYWKVVMKRFIDIIPMLIRDKLVEIPFEYETQNKIHRMILSGDKDVMRLMKVDRDILREARLNKMQLEQVRQAKRIIDTIRD
eukprot:197488_1